MNVYIFPSFLCKFLIVLIFLSFSLWKIVQDSDWNDVMMVTRTRYFNRKFVQYSLFCGWVHIRCKTKLTTTMCKVFISSWSNSSIFQSDPSILYLCTLFRYLCYKLSSISVCIFWLWRDRLQWFFIMYKLKLKVPRIKIQPFLRKIICNILFLCLNILLSYHQSI